MAAKSMVYFAQSGPGGPIKIGLTANLKQRMAAFDTHSSEKVTILAAQEGGRSLERELHERFAAHRIKGEWYRPADELLRYIANPEPETDISHVSILKTPRRAPSKPGEYLRYWRESRGWTREEAAEKLGVSARTLENWELGLRTPPALQVLERLLRSGRKLETPDD